MEKPSSFQENRSKININNIERRPIRETSNGDTATNAVQATPDFVDRVSSNERFLAMARAASAQHQESQPQINSSTSTTIQGTPCTTSTVTASPVDPEAEEPYTPSFIDEVSNPISSEVGIINNNVADLPPPTGRLNNLASERIGVLVSGAENPERHNIMAILSQVEVPGTPNPTHRILRTTLENGLIETIILPLKESVIAS